ncbi:MAG: hypothetical protein HOM21_02910, partial [Halobacteriovoraceae bacterium]|nr:hypothetical protein [Halobacteriovoraceae bacterium]
MKWTLLTLTMLIFSALIPTTSEAQLFKIINRTGLCVGALCDALEDEVNKDLPDADQSSYLKGMSNAGVAAVKGLGADYASNINLFVVGASVGIGADVGNNSMGDLISGDVKSNQFRGFGVNTSVLVGLNLGIFGDELWGYDLDDFTGFINFMKVGAPKKNGLEADVTAFGMHLQYKYIQPKSVVAGILQWGGVDFTSGFDYAGMDLSFTKSMSKTVSVAGNDGTFDGTAKVGAEVSTISIPFEVSSNVRLLYLLTLYGGLGADLAFGGAKSIANVTGNISVPGGSGTANLDLGSEEGPTFLTGRAFAGFQLNLWALRVYAQVNNGFTNDTVSVNVGLK